MFRQRLELLFILAFKELKVRYKTTWLGFLWSLCVPLVLMFVFMLIFRFIMRIELTPTLLLTALFPWTFFSMSLAAMVGSVVENGALIKKVPFPRELLPLSVVLANFFNFFLSMLILLFFDVSLTPWLLLVPLVMLLQFIFTLGLGFVVAASQVYLRDTRYMVEICLLAWFYLTPIVYPFEMVQAISKKMLYLFLLNPMAGLTVMYRDLIVHGMPSSPLLITITSILCLSTGLAGWLFFRRCRANMADFV